MNPSRCDWCGNDPLYIRYHDKEWGVPLHTDRKLFEFLILEGAQAGLNWITVLKKREAYRQAFDNFDFNKIANYDHAKMQMLMSNAGIIRNRLKIRSAVNNAQAFLRVRKEFGTFNRFIWAYVQCQPIQNAWQNQDRVPASSKISDQISKDLKRLGFSFAGSTICYAFMQATGMVNDHIRSCFRHQQLNPD